MTIRKQEFYEGAALHIIARTGRLAGIRYDPPFFLFNQQTHVLIKYSTKGRSPWGFTFTADEQSLLQRRSSRGKIIIALICGSDGIASFSYEQYASVAPRQQSSIHISCYRGHAEHYEVNGPKGTLGRKIAPSNWLRVLEE
jgi:hypothetical protein